ncbi:S9 family peptidase [Lysobacter antibioticus]|uniref:Prolyl oligopeptidase family protein n=1 Tax=Lysobacter antibioticus TaxID=84531 RepID=A0A0S2FB93_LYSAN|nr:prolyl oligopeptidase family protein [Lysobacter antibioticus]
MLMKITLFSAGLATALAFLPAQVVPASSPEAAPTLISRDLLFSNPERTNVSISPDGKYLSWVAPLDGVLNVWVAPAGELDKAKPATHDKARGITGYTWAYKPGTLLYVRDSGGDENYHVFALDIVTGSERDLSPYPKIRASIGNISPRHPESVMIGMNDRDAKYHDLYRVDLGSGERALVQKNEGFSGFLTDEDYRVRLGYKPAADGSREILALGENGQWSPWDRIPVEDGLTTRALGYTADGQTLYWLDSRGRDTGALFAQSADGKRRLLLENPKADIAGTLTDPTSGRILAASANYLREEWTAIDPQVAADLATLKKMGPGEASVQSQTLDNRSWIVLYSAPETPSVYYRYDRGEHGGPGKLSKLFSSRPKMEGLPLAPMWPQEIRSRDGLTLVSYLTLPPQADADGDGKPERPVPMVLNVHGGPWARDSYGYAGTTQWLANRGYAVLNVNYRGSTGFGKDFLNRADGEFAGKMHDDLIDAVAWAVKQGVTTKDQVAIMGGSYGGYATLVGLSFTPDTFKCGVDIVGPSSLVTLIESFPAYAAPTLEATWYKRVGDPRTESGRKHLLERSPIGRVDKISKPLLVGQGANDPRVTQAESDNLVAAMNQRKIPVSYALFADEGHGFARPENRKAFNALTEGFLGKCLGGRVEPIGQDLQGSSLSVPHGADGVPGLTEALKTHKAQSKK